MWKGLPEKGAPPEPHISQSCSLATWKKIRIFQHIYTKYYNRTGISIHHSPSRQWKCCHWKFLRCFCRWVCLSWSIRLLWQLSRQDCTVIHPWSEVVDCNRTITSICSTQCEVLYRSVILISRPCVVLQAHTGSGTRNRSVVDAEVRIFISNCTVFSIILHDLQQNYCHGRWMDAGCPTVADWNGEQYWMLQMYPPANVLYL